MHARPNLGNILFRMKYICICTYTYMYFQCQGISKYMSYYFTANDESQNIGLNRPTYPTVLVLLLLEELSTVNLCLVVQIIFRFPSIVLSCLLHTDSLCNILKICCTRYWMSCITLMTRKSWFFGISRAFQGCSLSEPLNAINFDIRIRFIARKMSKLWSKQKSRFHGPNAQNGTTAHSHHEPFEACRTNKQLHLYP